MTIAETLEWFKDHGYVFRARYDNQNQFMSEVIRIGAKGPSQDIASGYQRGGPDGYDSDATIRVFALQGQSPDEIVRRLMRAVEALEGITP